ncbi:MAG TPA: PIN domain-containing protein [Ktedonobacterales bacterium]
MSLPTVILDTNVFVAAGFNPHSASAQIVDAVKQGQIRMVWNDATRREIERIMRQIPPLRTYPVAELFRPEDRFTGATHPERFGEIPDPDDRKFAALAHAAGAMLISNDDHLLRHRDHMEVTVLTPAEFLQRQQGTNKAHRRTPRPT